MTLHSANLPDPELHAWQQHFQDRILEKSKPEDLESPEVSAEDSKEALGFRVYSDGYRLRLTEALSKNYATLAQWLGEACFLEVSLRYLEKHPPDTASLRWYGKHLAPFFYAWDELEQSTFLGDLAQLEWAVRHSMDALNAERLTVLDLAPLLSDGAARLEIGLHPSISLLELHSNAFTVYRALQSGEIPSNLTGKETHAAFLVVYRDPDETSRWRTLDAVEIHGLSLLHQNPLSFQALCETIGDQLENPEDPRPLVAYLTRWFKEGLLIPQGQASHFKDERERSCYKKGEINR